MDTAWLKQRIEVTKTQIVEYETAATDLASGVIQSYTLDTGQTNQTVTKASINTLQRVIDSLYNRLATLEARVYGTGQISVAPDW